MFLLQSKQSKSEMKVSFLHRRTMLPHVTANPQYTSIARMAKQIKYVASPSKQAHRPIITMTSIFLLTMDPTNICRVIRDESRLKTSSNTSRALELVARHREANRNNSSSKSSKSCSSGSSRAEQNTSCRGTGDERSNFRNLNFRIKTGHVTKLYAACVQES